MPKKITITCPSCSATLAAPISAAGKTLLCPKCRTGIPVPLPVEPAMTTNANPAGFDASTWQNVRTERAAVRRQQTWNTWRSIFRWLSRGLAIVLTLGVLIWGVHQFVDARQARAIVTLLEQQQFDQVLALEPDHIEALIGRAQQRLEPPVTNSAGAIQDLDVLQKISPQHPMWRETMVLALGARATDNAKAGDLDAARKDLSTAISLDGAGPQLASAREALAKALFVQATTNLRNESYEQALANCVEMLVLGSEPAQMLELQTTAWAALAERAATAPEIDMAIDALNTVPAALSHASLKEVFSQLYLQRSQLAHADEAIVTAAEHFQKSLALVPLKAQDLPYAFVLAEATIAASEEDPTLQNRQQAFSLLQAFAATVADSEPYTGLQVRMAVTMVLDGNPEELDGHLDFCAQSLSKARLQSIAVRGQEQVFGTTGKRLADRCIRRIRNREMDDAEADYQLAILLSPQVVSSLGPRFKAATNSTSEELPAKLREEIKREVEVERWERTSEFSTDLIRQWGDHGIPVCRLHPLDSSADMYLDPFAQGRRLTHFMQKQLLAPKNVNGNQARAPALYPRGGFSLATHAQVALPDDIPAFCMDGFSRLERLPSPEFPFGVVIGYGATTFLPQETGGIACERDTVLLTASLGNANGDRHQELLSRKLRARKPTNENVRQLEELLKFKWLEALHINEVPVSDEALSVISQLTQLRSLKLHVDPEFVTTAGMQQLQKLTLLNSLGIVIQGVDKGQVDFRQLSGIRSLRSLGVCNRGAISLEEMTQQLAACDQIENLSITAECWDVQPRGLDGIGMLTKLQTLDLCLVGPDASLVKISMDGGSELSRLRDLESLSLSLTELPDNALNSLAGNGTLLHLRLCGGKSLQTQFDAVSKISTLEWFSRDDSQLLDPNQKDSSNRWITEFEIQPGAVGNPRIFAARLKPISVAWTPGGFDNDFLKALSESNSVDSLTIFAPIAGSKQAKSSPETRFVISDISALKSLSVPFPLFGDRAAEMDDIALLTQLQSLDFQDGSFGAFVALSDSDMEKLSSITELRSLSLIALDLTVTDTSLFKLSKLKKLRSLSLPWLAPRITAEGIQRLQKALPDCWITR